MSAVILALLGRAYSPILRSGKWAGRRKPEIISPHSMEVGITNSLHAGQTNGRSSSGQKVPALGLVCDSPLRDFGFCLKGSQVKEEFCLRNTSNKIIGIDKIKTSCGCAHGDVSKWVLSPGEECKLRFTLSLVSEGRKHSSIFVMPSSGKPLALAVEGTSIGKTFPYQALSRPWDLGMVCLGSTIRKYIVSPKEKVRLSNPSIETKPHLFACSLDRVSDSYLCLEMKPTASASPGPFAVHMILKSCKGTQMVPIQGVFGSDLIIRPKSLFVSANDPNEFYITVLSRSKLKFRLLPPKNLPAGIELEIPRGSKRQQSHRARLILNSKALSSQKLVSRTQDPNRVATLSIIPK